MAAVAVPVLPNKVEAWKAWVQECKGPRKEEFEDLNRRMGLTAHRVWLMQSPQGAMAIVVHDGPGGDAFMGKLATSDHPFDVWFRERVSEFHGLDFSEPLPGPPPESVLDWRAA